VGRRGALGLAVLAALVLAAPAAGRLDEPRPARPPSTQVVVLVRDGDTGGIVRGARVRVGRQQAVRANGNGAAAFRVPWVGGLKVRATAPG
jgi:hypothetical protein